ncbi:hypothetical protein GUITHDRAFT_99435 [Guillardia theta CCMP2712]|uniref:SAP30-binding protein n=1 Tax=Guillardia theta (strain CCMP2712) TaxID=905079 RepID=L1K2H9_GUITC|nr:hypothetical protein GUITHDRAFT_99435 [Guillardia theta CCMP2712]EKX54784.1 hypothetical protein GUITHDRAFT_99435 [Guillardia theta CCMP2712]|eukprot:XP_005841764.1 hypothetical protein GUITHDRAFT_99435 [Guillardia theta CCMP2712]
MDLLGSYGGDSDESLEEGQQAEGGNAEAPAAADSLSNIVGYVHADDSAEMSIDKPHTSLAEQLSEQLGAAKDSDESSRKPRNPAVRAISKSSTPIVGSPGGIVPSDASSPETAERCSTPMLVSEQMPQVELPPAPTTEIEPKLIENVNKYTRLREKDRKVNADLYDKKEFHNPGILEVLMATYNIDGYGSNYPKELFDPAGYSPNMFYDSLRRQAAIKEEMKLAAAGGGMGLDAIAAGADAQGRKRSKWDQGLQGPSINTAATGIAIADLKRVQQLQQQTSRR